MSEPSILSRAAEPADIDAAYRLFLGRPAEPQAIDIRAGDDLEALVRDLLGSEEFAVRIRDSLIAGRKDVFVADFTPDAAALAVWAAGRLRLTGATRAALTAARDWSSVLGAVLADPNLRAGYRWAKWAPGVEGLAAALGFGGSPGRSEVIGVVEHMDPDGVSGWVLNRVDPAELLRVEVLADGRFLAAGRTGAFRRDIQEAHGGPGRYGFHIQIALGDRAGPVRLEVRESRSGAALGAAEVSVDPAARLDLLDDIGAELAAVKRALARVEALLPKARRLASFSLRNWDAYWRAFRPAAAPSRGAPPEKPAELRGSLVLAASGDPGRLDRALASILSQADGAWDLAVVAPSAAADAVRAVVERRAKASDMPVRLLPGPASEAERLNRAARLASAGWLVFLDEGLLAPDALDRLAKAMRRPGAGLGYADGDRLIGSPPEEFHADPQLRPDFDPDLLAQEDYLGALVAVRRDLFEAVGGFDQARAPAHRHDLWLRLSEALPANAVTHIGAVLHHGFEPPWADAVATAACAQAHLDRTGRPGTAEPHRDLLGPSRPGAARVRPSGLQAVRARVLIPTRDHFDLLEACLDGLEKTRASNAAQFDIVVVDNDSDPAVAAAAFPGLAENHTFTVVTSPGAFNWAAICNAAAAPGDEDVLIFLNNDTVALGPAWCDALCALAMREDVGAVGARLLYPDGSLQHAGMVIARDGWPLHEGVGLPASDGGYLGRHTLTHACVAVTGACLATRRAVFTELDGFDEAAFAIAFADVDYCMRARARGLKVLYAPDAAFHHLEGASRGLDDTAPKAALFSVEAAAFRARWGTALDLDPFYNPHFERFAPPFTRLAPPPAL
ncbi:MAG TPA: glycosyltransferase [Caulobacteraceae bacterium]|nr:glycosyltransferase [Caulobacteraceae bacterium]